MNWTEIPEEVRRGVPCPMCDRGKAFWFGDSQDGRCAYCGGDRVLDPLKNWGYFIPVVRPQDEDFRLAIRNGCALIEVEPINFYLVPLGVGYESKWSVVKAYWKLLGSFDFELAYEVGSYHHLPEVFTLRQWKDVKSAARKTLRHIRDDIHGVLRGMVGE